MSTFHVTIKHDSLEDLLLFDLPIVLRVKKHKTNWMGQPWMVEC